MIRVLLGLIVLQLGCLAWLCYALYETHRVLTAWKQTAQNWHNAYDLLHRSAVARHEIEPLRARLVALQAFVGQARWPEVRH